MHDSLKERTGCQYNGIGKIMSISSDFHAPNTRLAIVRFGKKIFDDFLTKVDVWVLFDLAFDVELISFLISLSSGGVHSSTLATVEQAELDTGPIDGLSHQTSERIDLSNDLAFGDSTDRGIAAHLANGIEVSGQ
jgi:hypothetical protein